MPTQTKHNQKRKVSHISDYKYIQIYSVQRYSQQDKRVKLRSSEWRSNYVHSARGPRRSQLDQVPGLVSIKAQSPPPMFFFHHSTLNGVIQCSEWPLLCFMFATCLNEALVWFQVIILAVEEIKRIFTLNRGCVEVRRKCNSFLMR